MVEYIGVTMDETERIRAKCGSARGAGGACAGGTTDDDG